MKQALIIDSEPSVRRLIRRVLLQAGYTTTEARASAIGLELARRAEEPQLVILNTTAPVNGSGHLLEHVASDPRLRRHTFVLVTAIPESLPPEIQHLVEELAMPVLGKPFTVSALLDALDQAERRLPPNGTVLSAPAAPPVDPPA
jgi:CheY-like chemotaxis protein